MSRQLITGLFIVMLGLLIALIVSSTRVSIAHGERDRLSESSLKLVKDQLEDTAKFFSKLANGPSGPGDNQLSELTWINNEALLVKHSGIATAFDESPGFRKLGYNFSEPLNDVQLVIYNLDNRMGKYHYQLSEQDKTRARELAKETYDLAQSLNSLQNTAYAKSGEAMQTLMNYRQKAEKVSKLSRDFVAELKKE